MSQSNSEIAKRSSSLTFWGIGASVLYVALMGIYSFVEFNELVRMEGNEFGDLLAGIFSPLAFLWLVLGFLQQGAELRASVEALELQGRELQHSVEQQRQLVEVTREQLEFQAKMIANEQAEADRISQPVLEMTAIGSSGAAKDLRQYNFQVENFGQRATNLKITDVVEQRLIRRTALLDAGEHVTYALELPASGIARKFIRASYVDIRGLPRSQSFHVMIENGALAIEPEGVGG